MKVVVAALMACGVAGLLYLSLDSGTFSPPAERLFSLPLLGLAAIFGASAWAASMSYYPKRAPLMAGLSAGIGVYAVVRLLL